MYVVEQIDYRGLVRQMAAAGIDGMADVLFGKLGEIGQPKTQNEIRYFWVALFNAAKANDAVWLWLCTAPHIRHFAPAEAKAGHVFPQFAEDMGLPAIGGTDDEPFQPSERPKQYSAEPTLENLQDQATALDACLREEGKKNPSNRYKSIEEYVVSFYYSGTGRLCARVDLAEDGYHALATSEGIKWLMETYPPQQ